VQDELSLDRFHAKADRIYHSGKQTITVTLAQKPARGGIDPYNLLDWEEGDNIEEIRL
jgi:hypothetical protein